MTRLYGERRKKKEAATAVEPRLLPGVCSMRSVSLPLRPRGKKPRCPGPAWSSYMDAAAPAFEAGEIQRFRLLFWTSGVP
jgi:hypothetical protein